MRSIGIAIGIVGTLVTSAAAEPCPPAATLTGDAALVTAIGELLSARGIAPGPPSCPAVTARVERQGASITVAIDGPDGPIERTVGGIAIAATVIESFTRVDVSAPLLAGRAEPPRPSPPGDPLAVVRPHVVTRPMSTRGVQLFAAAETSVATDRTSWLGAQVGACITLGPVCAAARLRFAKVAAGPGPWDGELERSGTELLLGIDVPLALGRMTLSPGFAAGLGSIRTRAEGTRHMGSETGGPRADVHATLSIPIGRRLALDLFAAADLTQETHVEQASTMELPGEPRGLLRIGVGLRYGGL